MGGGASTQPRSISSTQLASIARDAGKDDFIVELICSKDIDSSKALALAGDVQALEEITSSVHVAAATEACTEWKAFCAEADTKIQSQIKEGCTPRCGKAKVKQQRE